MRAQTPISVIFAVLGLGALDAGGQETPPTFRSGADVVVLDVVANDRMGQPLGDLRQDELQVTEDGKACAILSFRLVRARTAGSPKAAPAPATAPLAPRAPESAPTPARASLVVLVFDRLTTTTAPLARKGALDLVSRDFPADTWFAVFKIDYGIRLLTPFTTDATRLHSSIEAATVGDPDVRGSRAPALPPVKVSPELAPDQPVDPNNPPVPDLREVAKALGGEELALARRVEGYDSLYAVLGVARALGAVEGRKSVVYFAEAWHLPVGTRQVYDAAVSAANRANVAIHTVDARGLTSHKPLGLTPMDSVLDRFTADHREGAGEGATTPPIEAGGGTPTNGFSLRSAEGREEQLSGPRLEQLAQDTGGLAIADTNDLGSGLSSVVEELRQYYEVVYAPANPIADGRFRRIGVKVSRPGVRLHTRAGYYATASRTPTLAAYELPLMDALGAETPARDFPLRTGVLHFGPSGQDRECVVLAEVPLSGIQVASDEPNGVYRGHLTLLGYVKDEGGRVVARLTHDWPIEGPLPEKERARAQSAVFRRAMPLAPGRYVLEVAVQDRRSGGASVTRRRFEIPPAGAVLSLGSVAVLQRVSAVPPGTPASDPLRVGEASLVPRLGAPLEAGSIAELPLFVPVYPAASSGAVELSVEVRRDGQVVAQASPPLPAADADGRIPWIGSIPAGALGSGTYEIVVTAKQAEATAEARARFEVVPGQKAEAAPAPASKPSDPHLAAVLERAARYVVEYQESFRNLVAEEAYTQRAWGLEKGFATAAAPISFEDGSLLQKTRADVVFVRLAGDFPWGVFRDVFEANGVPVRDRDERLETLFRNPSPSAVEQARKVLEESARYNIGPHRTLNLPTLALLILHPRNQHRFSFKAGGRRRFGDFEGVEVEFEEVQRPSLASDLAGGSVPSDGRFWIEPARGAVLRSEVRYRFDPNRAVGFVSTEYRRETSLGMWVPVEMKERYFDVPGTERPVFFSSAEASARYSNFRQFSVTSEEKAAIPPD